MVLPSEDVEFLVALEAVMHFLIRDPLVLGTERGLNNFSDFFVHYINQQTPQYIVT